jgi:hypothetical protein
VTDRAEVMWTIYMAVSRFAKSAKLPIPEIGDTATEGMVAAALAKWSELVMPKPLIVLFDEIDVLTGGVLINFLRHCGEDSRFAELVSSPCP